MFDVLKPKGKCSYSLVS